MSEPRQVYDPLEILRLQMLIGRVEAEAFGHYVAQPERIEEIAEIVFTAIEGLQDLIPRGQTYICPPGWWKEYNSCAACPLSRSPGHRQSHHQGQDGRAHHGRKKSGRKNAGRKKGGRRKAGRKRPA